MRRLRSWIYIVLANAVIYGLPFACFSQEAMHEVKINSSHVSVAAQTISSPQTLNAATRDTIQKAHYLNYSGSSMLVKPKPVFIRAVPTSVDTSAEMVRQIVVAGSGKASAGNVPAKDIESVPGMK